MRCEGELLESTCAPAYFLSVFETYVYLLNAHSLYVLQKKQFNYDGELVDKTNAPPPPPPAEKGEKGESIANYFCSIDRLIRRNHLWIH